MSLVLATHSITHSKYMHVPELVWHPRREKLLLLGNLPFQNIFIKRSIKGVVPSHSHLPFPFVLTAMTSFHMLLYFSLNVVVLCSLSLAAQVKEPHPINALFLPIRKDTKTLQYYTTLEIATRGSYLNAVLDLGGEILWFNCNSYNLPSYKPISCGSAKCEAAKGLGCADCDGPAKPGCTSNTCGSLNLGAPSRRHSFLEVTEKTSCM